ISHDMKQQALQLLSDDWSIIDIVEVLGVSAKSIARWQDNYDTHEHVMPQFAIQRRRHILTSSMMLDIQALLQEDPSFYLDKISEWLAIFHDKPISLGTLCMNLKDFGLDWKMMRRPAKQRNELLRTCWMDYILNTFSPNQLVFLDESSKDGRTLARCFRRALSGQTPKIFVDHNRGEQ
ncbi:hypothetical protein C8R42DRAFT_570727, partial [Lentinula raphanica]